MTPQLARQGLAAVQRLCQVIHLGAERLLGPAVAPATGAPEAPSLDAAGRARLAALLHWAEHGLADELLPFWTAHTWDEDGGGFITHLDRAGRRLGPTDKYLVMQARMIWTLAAVHRAGITGRGYLERAAEGIRFLVDRMWAADGSGFHWAVGRGWRIADARKSTYAHAFVIYGLTEYAIAAGDDDALRWARRVLALVQERASDGAIGYREELDPGSGDGGDRTLNTHLHLLAALTSLAAATGEEAHRTEVRRIAELLLRRARDPRYGFAAETFDRDWRPRRRAGCVAVVPYGHNVELGWILLDAAHVADDAHGGIRAAALNLIDLALACGFDPARGGLARYGSPRGRVERAIYFSPARLDRNWWEQAELLVAAIEAYRCTGAPRYLAAFERQVQWVRAHQVDAEFGGWYERTTRAGRPRTLVKGHAWKCPYHEVRALLRSAAALRALGIRPD